MLGTAPRRAGDISCVSTYIPSGSPIQERVGGKHLWNAHLHSRVTSFPDLRCRGTEPSLPAPGKPVHVLQAELLWAALVTAAGAAYRMEKE